MITLDKKTIQSLCTSQVQPGWEAAQSGFPAFLEPVGAKRQSGNESWLNELQKQAKSAGKSKKKQDALMRRFLMEENLLGIRVLGEEALHSFLQECSSFLSQSRSFDPCITLEALFQAFRNYSVYAVFLMMNGLPQGCHRAILAYSLLYPYTDNYLDAPGRTAEEKRRMNRLILNKLSGAPNTGLEDLPEQERRVADLLDMIAGVYPHKEYPLLYESLLLIYDAQLESMKQQLDSLPLTPGQVLSVSIYKGSTSVLADRCLMPLPFHEEEAPFYLGLGFLLQLCDDLQDITEDLQAHSRTLFTLAGGPQERQALVNRMFHFTQQLFDCNKKLFAGTQTALDFLQKNCYTLILSCILGAPQFFEAGYIDRAQQYFPVTAAYLQNQSAYTRSTLLPMILSTSAIVKPPV